VTDDRLTTLCKAYGPTIFRLCTRILGDASSADDATQETFIRVQRHLERAPPGREALYWIYRIATNYCLNELRDRKRRPEPVAELPTSRSQSIDELLVDRDLAARIVSLAPPKVRAPAWLFHVGGLEHAEIAEALGVSKRTVANRLTAFAALARQFAGRDK
jgi:RNA polymerase sigma-70 factor, ECF subfamily